MKTGTKDKIKWREQCRKQCWNELASTSPNLRASLLA